MDNNIEIKNEYNFPFIWKKVDEIVFQNTHFETDAIKRDFLYKLVDTNLPNAMIDEKRSEYYLILGYVNYFCESNKCSRETINFFLVIDPVLD